MTVAAHRLGKFLSLLLFSGAIAAGDILPFSTDGCSAFPDGNRSDRARWQDCCVAHDLAYWAGGSYEDRLGADEALAECVADVGEPAIAKLMLVGVRAGGSPFFPTTYRWGYGWRYLRGYQALTETEKDQLMQMIDQMPADALQPKSPLHYLQLPDWPDRASTSEDKVK